MCVYHVCVFRLVMAEYSQKEYCFDATCSNGAMLSEKLVFHGNYCCSVLVNECQISGPN